MRELLPEGRGPHFRVWGQPALPGPPGLSQAARPPPDSFRRAVARQHSSSSECSTSRGAAPIRVDLTRKASSSLPFHSLPAVLDLACQFLILDHVHGIVILTQNSTIGRHGQLHPFCSIQIHSQPKFGLQPSDHRANPFGRHSRIVARPAGQCPGRPA